jgi:hypothetical protein
MRLKPVQTYVDASLKGRVPGELHAALTAYKNYYRETSGQPIGVAAHRADAPGVRRDGPGVPGVAAPDSERAQGGTVTS